MRILVTGANGFIGRNLCCALKERGFLVRGSMRKKVPAPIGTDEVIETGEIDESTNWQAALAGVDAIVHLAARVHVMHDTAAHPLELFRKVNVRGTERLARESAKSGVKRIVFISSVKVNGEGRLQPYSETDPPRPEEPYAISKQEAENVLNQVSSDTNMEIVVLRPPLVYGPSSPGNFSRFLKLIQKGIPLPLANINNLRSFIFVGNLVDAIANCITHPLAAGETFLVSDGVNISTTHLLRAIASVSNSDTILFPVPPGLLKACFKMIGMGKEIDKLTGSLCLDIGKIRNKLAWKPPFSMDEGLAETIKGLSA